MPKITGGLRNLRMNSSVLILVVVCSLLNAYHSSAEMVAAKVTSIEDWQLISSSVTTASGPGVNTYMKSYPGTQLSAFRGVGTLDIHISVAMGLFCDFNLAYEWVAMLESIQSYPINSDIKDDKIYSPELSAEYGDCRPNGATDIVHQTLKIPWPISPREIVLERNFTYVPPKHLQKKSENIDVTGVVEVVELGIDGEVVLAAVEEITSPEDNAEEGGTIIVRYHSVEDSRIPMHPGRVRAESPLTMWRFQDVTQRERALRGSDQDMTKRYTEIEVQVLVDSKGYIPVWFINSIQRLWPARAMQAFNKLIKKKDVKNINRVCSSRNSTTACSDGVKPFMPIAHW